jgi:Sortilin, neurotensin receptor 3,
VSWVQASNFDAGTAFAAFDRHTFGDMAPYVYRTTDFGKTWTPLLTAQDSKGVRGYAHVVKDDLVQKDLLFVGTEFGLFVSIDSGKTWAQFKGSRFPAVAVRDLAVHPRDHDLVLATHGRGIWVIDDITPWRALTPDLLNQEAAFVSARPVQQRIDANGGGASGAATFTGDNPPDAAVITYYQKSRHLFGKLKLEVLDSTGRVIDNLPASKRPGLNRVVWSMHEKPPRVPPAVQIAGAGTQGPRYLPGTYTVRMTKNGKVSETKLTVGLDRRVKFSEADRKAQFEAAMKVHALFGDETALMDRILFLRGALAKSKNAIPEGDEMRKAVSDFDGKVDAVRKQIVATTEGGAITGEERLREHTDQLYGAILAYEGKPGDYQIARIEALRKELGDVTRDFDQLVAKDLPAFNDALKAKGKEPIPVPPAKVAVNEDNSLGGDNALPAVLLR